jgi:hypothetical protein
VMSIAPLLTSSTVSSSWLLESSLLVAIGVREVPPYCPRYRLALMGSSSFLGFACFQQADESPMEEANVVVVETTHNW